MFDIYIDSLYITLIYIHITLSLVFNVAHLKSCGRLS